MTKRSASFREFSRIFANFREGTSTRHPRNFPLSDLRRFANEGSAVRKQCVCGAHGASSSPRPIQPIAIFLVFLHPDSIAVACMSRGISRAGTKCHPAVQLSAQTLNYSSDLEKPEARKRDIPVRDERKFRGRTKKEGPPSSLEFSQFV